MIDESDTKPPTVIESLEDHKDVEKISENRAVIRTGGSSERVKDEDHGSEGSIDLKVDISDFDDTSDVVTITGKSHMDVLEQFLLWFRGEAGEIDVNTAVDKALDEIPESDKS